MFFCPCSSWWLSCHFSTEGGKIFWGTEAKPHSHPYMAFLEISESESHQKQCDGFLVEKDIVMTAAHCNGR
ncbi:hypothetical protein U0070_026286 [Myodes glareolus]|uniref:Peptidase S1 domain-containing protein n=1 Tax=Myodes glareolus TaxID=447135 RepID=A0AAW0H0W5_MYOGA